MSLPAPLVRLVEAGDASRYGGKAARLAAALASGLPVPPGWAMAWPDVALIASSVPGSRTAAAKDAVAAAVSGGGAWAVRSSAVGEDSDDASFAGAHLTLLGLVGPDEVVEGVRRVHASASDPGALAYRARRGIAGEVRMGVVIQQMVDADVAGVLFTRNPITNAAELVVEASWGLGEAVVGHMVTPDHVRTDLAGRVLETVIGEKDLAIRLSRSGATEEVPVPPPLVSALCLSAAHLRSLRDLAFACDRVYGAEGHDLEFAFMAGSLYLMQRRPITHG